MIWGPLIGQDLNSYKEEDTSDQILQSVRNFSPSWHNHHNIHSLLRTSGVLHMYKYIHKFKTSYLSESSLAVPCSPSCWWSTSRPPPPTPPMLSTRRAHTKSWISSLFWVGLKNIVFIWISVLELWNTNDFQQAGRKPLLIIRFLYFQPRWP